MITKIRKFLNITNKNEPANDYIVHKVIKMSFCTLAEMVTIMFSHYSTRKVIAI